MSDVRENREINTEQVSRYLSHAFAKASQHLGNKNEKGTKLYSLQVEFCYLIDDIKRGPKYIVPKVIARANTFIEEVSKMEREEKV